MRPGDSRTTTDHEEIRKWVETKGGHPSVVKATEKGGSGLLRIDFGKPEKSLEEIDWDEFFRIFDENELAFLYQDKKKGGEDSTFFKFVRRGEE